MVKSNFTEKGVGPQRLANEYSGPFKKLVLGIAIN